MLHLVKIVKVSEKIWQLRRNYRPVGVISQLVLPPILLPLGSGETTENCS